MGYAFWADVLVVLHAAYVAFVVVGLLLILLGVPFRWEWVRNPWFRVIHLLMIGVVALETLVGWECPLTTWENQLRLAAGEPITGTTFVGRLLNEILFLSVPAGLIVYCHLGCAAIIVLAFVLAPPHWKRREPLTSSDGRPALQG